MNDLIKIYEDIIGSFSSLWNFKFRDDNTLEVITPYSTTTNKYVSLFVTYRDGTYIVSDGGLLNNESYDSVIDYENECLLKILYHLEDYYNVHSVEAPSGLKHYFRKTTKPIIIPSLIYDLAQFVSMCASTASVSFIEEEQKKEKESFQKQANAFLQSIIDPNRIRRNAYLDRDKYRAVRFNAIISKNSSISLVNYITGTRVSYFKNSISRANIHFEIAENSSYKNHITNKIALLNDTAAGFEKKKLTNYLEILTEHLGQKPVNWTEKEKLSSILN